MNFFFTIVFMCVCVWNWNAKAEGKNGIPWDPEKTLITDCYCVESRLVADVARRVPRKYRGCAGT